LINTPIAPGGRRAIFRILPFFKESSGRSSSGDAQARNEATHWIWDGAGSTSLSEGNFNVLAVRARHPDPSEDLPRQRTLGSQRGPHPNARRNLPLWSIPPRAPSVSREQVRQNGAGGHRSPGRMGSWSKVHTPLSIAERVMAEQALLPDEFSDLVKRQIRAVGARGGWPPSFKERLRFAFCALDGDG